MISLITPILRIQHSMNMCLEFVAQISLYRKSGMDMDSPSTDIPNLFLVCFLRRDFPDWIELHDWWIYFQSDQRIVKMRMEERNFRQLLENPSVYVLLPTTSSLSNFHLKPANEMLIGRFLSLQIFIHHKIVFKHLRTSPSE